MKSYQVAVTDYGFPDLEQERSILEPLGFEFVTGQCRTGAEVAELCRDADAVLTQWAPVTAEAIASLRKCKIIVRYGIGVDNVDLEAAKQRNIPVVNVPDYAVQEVADHTLSLMLAIVRKIPQIDRQVRRGVWEISPCRPIMGLQDKVLGVAGFGNISRAVVQRAKAFGLTVIAYDPFVHESVFNSFGVEKADWQTLLSRSDIVSVHMPLTKETKHIFNAEAFRAMKNTSFLVNTSRGGTVETPALIDALQNGEIAGAALDVLEQEPIPADSPLLQMEQCLVTSHCAWYSESSLLRLQEYAALEIKRLFSGEHPLHVVNGISKR